MESQQQGIPFMRFQHVPRTINKAAHVVDRTALDTTEDIVWIDECPTCIRTLVHEECIDPDFYH